MQVGCLALQELRVRLQGSLQRVEKAQSTMIVAALVKMYCGPIAGSQLNLGVQSPEESSTKGKYCRNESRSLRHGNVNPFRILLANHLSSNC